MLFALRVRNGGIRKVASTCLFLACSATAFACVAADTETPMKWESDVASALEKAKQEGRPLFIMMTAEWCGPCKHLEQTTLSTEIVQSALKQYVCVKAYEDKELEEKYGLNGYPTLLFIDSDGERVHHRTSGSRPVGPFLKVVIEAMGNGNLQIPENLQQLADKSFAPNQQRIAELITAGDGRALFAYLQPANDDILRSNNYLLAKVNLPPGVDRKMVLVLDSNNTQYPIPESGFLCITGQASSDTFEIRTLAKGCRSEKLQVKLAAGKAIATSVLTIKPLTAKESIRLVGQVKLPNGNPAPGAIVRLLDWDWVKADQQGAFVLADVAAGKYTIRAEYPGGEYHQEIELASRGLKKHELVLKPAATVGIRWALQTEEKNPSLIGDSVVQGEAYFSIKHSRFSLARGTVVRQYLGSDFMLEGDVTHVAQYLPADKLAAINDAPDPKFFSGCLMPPTITPACIANRMILRILNPLMVAILLTPRSTSSLCVEIFWRSVQFLPCAAYKKTVSPS